MVMPFRPPINEPTIIKKKVSTTSRNVVLRTLMVSFTPNARTKSKQRNATVETESRSLSRGFSPHFLRCQPLPPAVWPSSARTSLRLSARLDRLEGDRRAALCLQESAAPADPESVAGSCDAAAVLHRLDHSLLAVAVLPPPV